MASETLPAIAFKSPAIALSGVVDYEMYTKFRTQFDSAAEQSIVVIELSTLGDDPEVARMMGEDVRFASGRPFRLQHAPPLEYNPVPVPVAAEPLRHQEADGAKPEDGRPARVRVRFERRT